MLTSCEANQVVEPISLRKKSPMSPLPMRRSNQTRMTLTPANNLKRLPQFEPRRETAMQDDSLELLESILRIREMSEQEIIETEGSKIPKVFRRLRFFGSKLCERIVKSRWFEWLIILVILLNMGTIIAEDPEAEEQSATLKIFELIFLYIYTAEATLKIGGLGLLFNKGAYLRSRWNILDFVIVCSAWLEFILQEGVNLSVLRTLRLIRPLKSISSIRGLKTLMLAVITSFTSLGQFLIVLLFFLLIFAIGGVQMWMGSLRFQCMDVHLGLAYSEFSCGNYKCPGVLKCAKVLDNPNYGMTNFDNILFSFLAVFQSITAEGWYGIMVSLQRAFSYFVFLYFIPLVFIGAFLILNLILAVIKASFREAENKQLGNVKTKKSHFKCLVLSDDPEDEVKYGHTKMNKADFEDKKISRREKRRKMSFVKLSNDYKSKRNLYYQNSQILDETFIDNPFPTITRRRSLGHMITVDNFEDLTHIICKKVLRSNSPRIRSAKTLSNYGVIDTSNKKLVLEIDESFKLLNSSSDDVVPKETARKTTNCSSGFSYTLEQIPEIRTEKLLASYNNSYVQAFLGLTCKMHSEEAFVQLVSLAQKQVNDAFAEDRLYGVVIGHWSGRDVSPGDNLTLENFNYRLRPKGLLGKWYIFKHPLCLIVSSNLFNNVMTLCIVLNTIVLASDHYGISSDMERVLTILNNIFTLIFAIEMLLKLTGLGVSEYFRDPMNYLDGSVVIVSIVEFFFLSQSSVISAFRTIRIFRSFRVLRVARLFRYMTSMATIIKAISMSLSRIAYLALLLLLLIIIFALLGMQIFGGRFDFPDGTPRQNFDSFLWAFMTVFQLLTTENWQDVAYNGMRSSVGPASCLYFVVWIFIGNFVLLNLFLAILMDSFGEKPETYSGATEPESSLKKGSTLYGNSLMKKRMKKEKEKLQMIEFMENNSEHVLLRQKTQISKSKSYFVFSKSNYFRVLCIRITNSSKFDSFILLIIALSSVKLIIDTYIINEPDESDIVQVSRYMDVVFTTAFMLEFVIKSISMGFIFNRNSYLRDGWNILDFGIIIVSLLELSISDINISALKVLRLLRTLRPLRFITQNLSMKIVVVALLESLAALFNVIIVLLIVWLMFAILGVSLFGGKFYTCENEKILTQTLCEEYGYIWENASSNFDNVFNAMLTLFIISSLEGWPEIMMLAVDSTSIGMAPRKNASELSVIYFIVFIFVGSFFFLNLFIGVIFDTFNEAKRSESSVASLFLAPEHVVWVEIQGLVIKSKPMLDISSRPSGKVRRYFYDLTKSSWFDLFIIVCIILNTLQMAIAYEEASSEYTSNLETINFVFTCVFIVEAAIKMAGLGTRAYFHSAWNKFDFFVVAASVVDIVIEFSLNSSISILRSGPQLIRAIRVLRVSKLVRLFKELKGIQQLITVLAYSFTAILNVLSLLLLIFFIYSVLGVFLFHDIKGDDIDEFTNFDNFGMAMLALLRISTGENWHEIMFDGVSSVGWWSSIYFISFVTITTFIMLNLFVMVILQTFDDLKYNKQSAIKQFNKDLKCFNKAWEALTRPSKGKRIHYRLLTDLMYKLGENLGVPYHYDKSLVLKRLSLMDIHIEPDGFVYFHDMLYAILRVKYTKRLSNPEKNANWKKILRYEESRIEKELQKLRPEQGVDFKGNDKMNLFFSMSFLRVVFMSWKNYTNQRILNSGSSVTSRFQDINFPGFNTIEDFFNSE